MYWMLSGRFLIENAIYYAGGGFALWKGGRAERWVAAALLIENTISILIQDPHPATGPRYLTLAMDAAVLLVILWVAFSTPLRWPLLASALQILSILTFVARIIDPTVGSWAYLTIDIAISFILMAAVVYGAFVHARNLRALRAPRSSAPDGP